jgi:hypothetical protein
LITYDQPFYEEKEISLPRIINRMPTLTRGQKAGACFSSAHKIKLLLQRISNAALVSAAF